MTTSTDLHGKTAIITGASRGIGLAAAQALATAGANVVLTSRSRTPPTRPPPRSPAAPSASPRTPSTKTRPAAACDLTLETFGSVDILVNNAGTNPAYGPMIEQDHGRFAKTFDVNLWAPLLWTEWPPKLEASTASVINPASIGGLSHEAGSAIQHPQGRLIYLTKQLAPNLPPKIRFTPSPGLSPPAQGCGRTTRHRSRRPPR